MSVHRSSKRKSRKALWILAAAAGVATGTMANAAARYWDGVTGNWNDLTKWSTASGATTPDPTTVPGSGDTPTFNITIANGPETVYLNGAEASGAMTFNNTGTTTILGGIAGTPAINTLTSSGNITVASTAGAVTIGDSAGLAVANLNLGGTAGTNYTWSITTSSLTVNNTINFGSDKIQKTNSGTLTLNGANTGAGVTTAISSVNYNVIGRLDAGTVVFGNKSAFGTGAVYLNGAALQSNTALTGTNAIANTFVLAGNTTIGGSNNLEFSGPWNENGGNRTITVNNTSSTKWSGTISLTDVTATNRTLTVNVAATAGTTEISGAIQDTTAGTAAGLFTKEGTGTLILSGNSTFTGDMRLRDGATILSGNVATNSLVRVSGESSGFSSMQITSTGSLSPSLAELRIGQNGPGVGKLILGNAGGVKNQTVLRLTEAANNAGNSVVGGNGSVSTLTIAGSATTDVFHGLLGGTGANENNLGITYAGSGLWTLAASNTYNGATTVQSGTLTIQGSQTGTGAVSITGGTLTLSGSGSVNNSSGIIINGASAKLLQTSTAASTVPITLTNGTIDGTGTVGATTVADNALNIVANGNGGTTALTLGSLEYQGNATTNLKLVQSSPTSPGLIVTNALKTQTVNATGMVTLNVNSDTGQFASGTVNLIGFGAGSAFDAGDFQLSAASLARLTSRQLNGGLVLNGNDLAWQINNDTATWTGKDDGNWAVGLTGTQKNWKLTTSGAATDYLEGDTVVFNNTGLHTAIDLGTDVTPGNMTFNNSGPGLGGVDYSISSAAGKGIKGPGSLTKSGLGTLTINTANSFSGGVVVSGGVLGVGSDAALGATTNVVTVTNAAEVLFTGNTTTSRTFSLGTGTLAIGSGVILNASGATFNNGHLAGPGTLEITGNSTVNGMDLLGGSTLSIDGGVTLTGAVTALAGATVKGSGTIIGDLTVLGTVSPGSSPGILTASSADFGAGGHYRFEIADASGLAGTGFDELSILSGLNIAAGTSPGSRFIIDVQSLDALGHPGLALNFDRSHAYQWTLAHTGSGITGFSADSFAVDSTGFLNPNAGRFWVSELGNDLFLNYAVAVPLPPVVWEGAALVMMAGIGAMARRRLRAK